MDQEDYLLREIEKIGAIMNAIRQKILGGKGNLAITIEQQIENVKGRLLSEINFDLDKFLELNIDESNKCILNIEGFNTKNIELLAECLSEIGFSDKCDNSTKYLEKALQLYELCNSESKTYSIKRETNIMVINLFLDNYKMS